MSLHIHLPSHTKLDERVAEVVLDEYTHLETANFTVRRYKESDTHKAVIDEVLHSIVCFRGEFRGIANGT
jgi:hypothetical protein